MPKRGANPHPGEGATGTMSDPQGEQINRQLIALFARGAIGEHLQSAVLPWDPQYEQTGKETLLAYHIEEVWKQMDQEWRFFGAIDSASGNVIMTVPTLGWLGLQRAKHRGNQVPATTQREVRPSEEPDLSRKLIVLFSAGAVGEHLQSGVLRWDDRYAKEGAEIEVAAEVEAMWSQMAQAWRFFGALDNATGNIITTVPALGWLALQRVRAHDTLALSDDAPPQEETTKDPGK